MPTTAPALLVSRETVSESIQAVQMWTSAQTPECEHYLWLLVTRTPLAITPTVAMNALATTVIRTRSLNKKTSAQILLVDKKLRPLNRVMVIVVRTLMNVPMLVSMNAMTLQVAPTVLGTTLVPATLDSTETASNVRILMSVPSKSILVTCKQVAITQ